jgi:hypothetical protein
VRGRLEAAAASQALTPFVGREDELRLLVSRWERALGGEGQVALIVGEAGSENHACCSGSMSRSAARRTLGSKRTAGPGKEFLGPLFIDDKVCIGYQERRGSLKSCAQMR